MAGIVAGAGALVCVTALYLGWGIPPNGPGEVFASMLYLAVAVFALVPVIGGVLFARRESPPTGPWLVWFILAVLIVLIDMLVMAGVR